MKAQTVTMFTRREALAAAMATVGSLALNGKTPAFDSPEPSPYGPFKMGLQSYSLRHFKFAEALAMTQELGLHFWEAYPEMIPMEAEKSKSTIEAAAKHGVKVVGWGVIGFTKDHDANRKIFEFGKAMGLSYISCDPSKDSFDSLDKLTDEYDIPVGIHNHGPGHHYATIDGIFSIIKDHSPKIGCCIDTGHFLRSKEDPVRAVEVFDKRIYGVHLKDVKNANTFTVLGEGDLRLKDLLKALATRKYAHNLALEYEENEASPMADLKACLAAQKKTAATL